VFPDDLPGEMASGAVVVDLRPIEQRFTSHPRSGQRADADHPGLQRGLRLQPGSGDTGGTTTDRATCLVSRRAGTAPCFAAGCQLPA